MARMATPVSIDSYIAESLAASSDVPNARATHESLTAADAHNVDNDTIQPAPPPKIYVKDIHSGRNSSSKTASRPISVHTTESSSGISYEDEIRYRTVSGHTSSLYSAID